MLINQRRELMKIDNFGSVGSTQMSIKPQSVDVKTPAPATVQVMPSESVATPSVKVETLNGKDWSPENQGESITPEMMDQAVKQANKSLSGVHKQIERSIHETTRTVMYVLRDTDTKEIISEFPPKKIQDMIAKMWELAGLFVDEKA
jgi:uncharacterized FlaG/YvyC family protein